ncbi:MAG: ATP-binding cassette domain-containing protein [Desulfobulbaceae bacterium]|nr:ATP-binding cassette domain-containing protein [Desulfobulbaceae bacterium]
MNNLSGQVRKHDHATPGLAGRALSKSFDDAGHKVQVFDQLNITVPAADTVAIIGASGAGKSTLLHVLGSQELPDSGQVLLQGRDIASVSDRERGRLRNRHLGFVYQFHHLLPEFSAPLLRRCTFPGPLPISPAAAGSRSLMPSSACWSLPPAGSPLPK